MSIRAGLSGFRFLRAVAVGLIGTATLAIGLTIWWMHSNAISDAFENNDNLAVVINEQLANSIQSIDLVLTEIKGQEEILGEQTPNDFDRVLRTEGTYKFLAKRLSRVEQAEFISLADKNGKLVNTSRLWPSPAIDLSDREHYQYFKNNDDKGIYISNSEVDRIKGTQVIFFSKRINGVNDTFLGVVTVAVRLTYFQSIYKSVASLHDKFFVLLHRGGTIIVRYPDHKERAGEKLPASSPWYQLVSQDGGHFRSQSPFDGEARLVSVRPLRDYPLVVDIAVSETAALATWRIQAITLGIGALLVMFCSGFLLKALNKQFRRLANSEATVVEKANELERANVKVDAALNNMTQGLNMFDTAGRLVVCNERYLQMYRLSPDIIRPGCSIRDLVQQRIAAGTFFSVDPEKYIADLTASMEKTNPISTTMDLTDGRTITVISQPIADGGGWVVTHEDITERRRAEKERDRSQELANTVIENVPVTIVVKDARDLRFVLINRAGEEFYGAPRDNIIGKTVHDIFPSTVADRITEQDKELLRSGERAFFDEHPIAMPGNRTSIVTSTKVSIRDPNGKPQYLLTVTEDRTQRKRDEARIEHMAHHDPLTDLSNRTAFNECLDATLEQAAATGETFAVLCLDLDRFKEVNDVFGHAVGDELLRQIARRLEASCEGAFLARLGGDEFTVITAVGPQPATAEAISERISGALAKNIEIDGHSLRARLTTGVSIYPNDGTDAESLVANADAALYRAKAEERGSIRFFEADMDKRLREKRALQHDLLSAIARNELELYYQPQALIGGEITGFEALVRWHHPSRGMISPGTFIPLAEQSGLILSLGEWILREACREAASWPKPLSIAINLSPMQFRHGDLPGLVHEILLETGLTPGRLELEITEGVLVDDFARAVSLLRRLKNLGVRIAMDDFGTGYSSLSYLQSFPFDKIKIDQSFISKLSQNSQSEAIIRAVIGLGRGLDLPVIAEGVETEEQLAFLSKEGCNEMQGFLIGRPKPISDYDELVGREKTRSASAALAS
jgi:diguanylate cyclase (GGDEF)-like protein/PAS domain S-box-containing protein